MLFIFFLSIISVTILHRCTNNYTYLDKMAHQSINYIINCPSKYHNQIVLNNSMNINSIMVFSSSIIRFICTNNSNENKNLKIFINGTSNVEFNSLCYFKNITIRNSPTVKTTSLNNISNYFILQDNQSINAYCNYNVDIYLYDYFFLFKCNAKYNLELNYNIDLSKYFFKIYGCQIHFRRESLTNYSYLANLISRFHTNDFKNVFFYDFSDIKPLESIIAMFDYKKTGIWILERKNKYDCLWKTEYNIKSLKYNFTDYKGKSIWAKACIKNDAYWHYNNTKDDEVIILSKAVSITIIVFAVLTFIFIFLSLFLIAYIKFRMAHPEIYIQRKQ